jgi:hypothetical protein
MVVVEIVPLASVQLVLALTDKGLVLLFTVTVGAGQTGTTPVVGGEIVKVMIGLVAIFPVESMTSAVKLNVPCTAGIPEITPEELIVSPTIAGKVRPLLGHV